MKEKLLHIGNRSQEETICRTRLLLLEKDSIVYVYQCTDSIQKELIKVDESNVQIRTFFHSKSNRFGII